MLDKHTLVSIGCVPSCEVQRHGFHVDCLQRLWFQCAVAGLPSVWARASGAERLVLGPRTAPRGPSPQALLSPTCSTHGHSALCRSLRARTRPRVCSRPGAPPAGSGSERVQLPFHAWLLPHP